ncbi:MULTISPECIES: YunG family protein [unclassified Bradyrhizobium]|uniref:YunG family protein n=1 Tax=unclassified Bradyrhizobium TaxID=2631580 RepID=UPI002FEEE619
MTAGSTLLVDFYRQLRRSWSIETSSRWRRDNPASGQCGVTALVVHDKFGGETLKTDVNGAWHFYNRIDGSRVDFTMSQFDSPIGYDDVPSSRDEALGDCSKQQYELLRSRVADVV